MNIIPLLIAGAALAGIAFATTGKKIKALDISAKNGRLRWRKLGTITVKIDLSIKNNSSSSILLQDVYITLFYKGNKVANVSNQDIGTRILAKDTLVIDNIDIKVSSAQLFADLLNALSGDWENQFLITGKIKADGLEFPFKQPMRIYEE